MADDSTDFGFQQVPWRDKARRVRGVFDSVAGNYDLMNDLMSGGAHRLWKRFTLSLAALRPGQSALDVAGGTGDLAAGLAGQVGQHGTVILTDINAAMLARGRDRLIDAGFTSNLRYVQANAESLPFADSSFDCVTIGFGLRNVTDEGRGAGLDAPGVEAGRPVAGARVFATGRPGTQSALRRLFFPDPAAARENGREGRSELSLPGRVDPHAPGAGQIAGDAPGGGLEGCRYHNLTGGIVAVHRGYRS